MVGFSKYEFYNKLLDSLKFLELWTQLSLSLSLSLSIYIYIYIYILKKKKTMAWVIKRTRSLGTSLRCMINIENSSLAPQHQLSINFNKLIKLSPSD